MDVFYWIAVAAVTITSSSRITRLVTYDKFPPVAWLRDKYADLTDAHDWSRGWQLLAFCGYCASFWVTAFVVGWGWYAGVYGNEPVYEGDNLSATWWWIVNGIFGGSYLAAILMAHDGDVGDEPTVSFNQTVLRQVNDFPFIEGAPEGSDEEGDD